MWSYQLRSIEIVQNKTLLLINSNQVLMDLSKKIFERSGYSVHCAVGIAASRLYLMNFVPDGIILDMDLPDGMGFDYCRKLREEYNVPIMMLSNDKDDELPALQAGASDFIKKPYEYDIIIRRIGIMLDTKIPFLSVWDKSDGENAAGTAAGFIGAGRSKFGAGAFANSKKSKLRVGLTYVAASMCFVLLASQVGIYGLLSDPAANMDITDFKTPLSGLPLQPDGIERSYAAEEWGQAVFPEFDSVTIPAETQNVKISLPNPEENNCYLSFAIILADTGEPIYASGMIKPGMCLEDITLQWGLPEGEYDAIMKIRAFAPKGFAEIDSKDIEFSLKATIGDG